MGFSNEVKEEVLVKSARHCCVCHRYKGLKIEVHHIKPKHQGGLDTIENAIALCFDCHADAGHYFANHPKGLKLSPNELLKHKEEWFRIVSANKIREPNELLVELSINDTDFKGTLTPTFVKETTIYSDRDSFKKAYQALGKDPMEFVSTFKSDRLNESKSDSILNFSDYINYKLKKVNSYDDLINYLNMDFIRDSEPDNNCQPFLHKSDVFTSKFYKEVNKSNCTLMLKLTNRSLEVLEDYKVYLNFENVLEVDSVNKTISLFDRNDYKYNVRFSELTKGVFIPEYNVLVQNDSVTLDAICFRPNHKAKVVILNWELFARNAYCSGYLKINMKPKFEKSTRHKFVENGNAMKNLLRILPKLAVDYHQS